MTTTDLAALPSRDDILTQTLIGPEAVEILIARLRAARFEFAPEDAMVIASAEGFVKVETEDDYRRGYQLLEELADLDRRIEAHYNRFKDPLNKMRAVILEMAGEDQKPIAGTAKGQLSLKANISQIVGKWKADKDRADRELAAAKQRVADEAARAAHEALSPELFDAAARLDAMDTGRPCFVLFEGAGASGEDVWSRCEIVTG